MQYLSVNFVARSSPGKSELNAKSSAAIVEAAKRVKEEAGSKSPHYQSNTDSAFCAPDVDCRWVKRDLDISPKGNDIMNTEKTEVCCPRFNPDPWTDKVITWENKRFVRDHVTSLFHIPLNYGAVMGRNDRMIRAAGAATDTRIILTNENSLWGADVYIEVSKDVPNAKMATLSGTFMTRVFEGPYRNMRVWIDDMKAHVAANGRQIRKMYFYYTTCPKCAKKYGKNYVVILAEVAAG